MSIRRIPNSLGLGLELGSGVGVGVGFRRLEIRQNVKGPFCTTSARIVQKQLGSAVRGHEVESRHARCMWDWEEIAPLDPFVEGGSALSSTIIDLKRRIFVDCLVQKCIFMTKRCPNDRTHDGGRVIIRSKPFIDSEVV